MIERSSTANGRQTGLTQCYEELLRFPNKKMNDLLCKIFHSGLDTMENVGTPLESDNDRDRVVRHLEAKGGVQLQQRLAPRAFVRGRYEDEGGNVKLRVGRLINSGTYLRLTLTIGGNDVLDVFVDQLYPYGMQKNEEVVAKYGGLVRKTLVDKDSLCWTWMGFGYSIKELTYCDISEHIMPRSVGYGYHSPECPKTTSGSWHWCPERPTCGKIAWALGCPKITFYYILFFCHNR